MDMFLPMFLIFDETNGSSSPAFHFQQWPILDAYLEGARKSIVGSYGIMTSIGELAIFLMVKSL